MDPHNLMRCVQDQEYIDVVKCLLRVDPQQRPSVYKFLGMDMIESIRDRLRSDRTGMPLCLAVLMLRVLIPFPKRFARTR